MQDGIKLLIDRMEHYPEEFFGELSYRWSEIMQDIAKHGPEFLEEEDLLMLNKKVKEVRRKELNAKIVQEIATGTRLQTAQSRLEKTTTTQYTMAGYGQAISKQEGQKVWWSDSGLNPSYDPNKETYFGKSVLDMIERGQDNAMLQNIRATNRMLEDELLTVKKDIARRDEERSKAQSYKKRNNQNWK